MSPIELFLSAINAFTITKSVPVILVGRPHFLPRARAAFNHARVRSRIKFFSNSQSEANKWNTNFPLGEVVSICSIRETNQTPLFSRSFTIRTRSARLRPRRSNRQTMRLSPARKAFKQFSSSGRAVFFQDACS